MDSSHTLAPTDEELLRLALDKEALPAEKQTHLTQCATCQQQLAEITRTHRTLVANLYRRFCPDGLQLSFYCADLLPLEERTRLANHLLGCPLCATEVADTRRFMRDVPVELEPAPVLFPSVRRVLGVLVRQQAQPVRRDPPALREDSGMPAASWPRQYHIQGVDLSLHLTKAGSGEPMLLGILTSSSSTEKVDKFEKTNVELYAGSYLADIEQAPPLRHTLVDDLGNIVFKSVPPGRYALIIHLPDQDLVIEQVTIEPT